MSGAVPTQECRGLGAMLRAFTLAVRLVFNSGCLRVVLLGISTVLAGLVPVVTVWIGKLLLDALTAAMSSGAGRQEIRTLLHMLGLQLGILLAGASIQRLQAYSSISVGKQLALNMKRDILRKTADLDLAHFDDPQLYDLITRARNEAEGKPLALLQNVGRAASSAITFISMAMLVASASGWLMAVMIVACIPSLLIQLRFGEKRYRIDYRLTEASRMAGYWTQIMTSRPMIPDILSLGLWSFFFQKWASLSGDILRQDLDCQRQSHFAQGLADALIQVATIGASIYIIYIGVIRSSSMTVGAVMMYTGGFAAGMSALTAGLLAVSMIYENALFFSNLLEFYAISPRIQIQSGPAAPAHVETIELRGIGFKYPGDSRWALRGVDLTFRRGECCLLLGANGAGKSTLIKLLNRLYDPTEGCVLLNGTDIRTYDIGSLRAVVGVAFQDFARFILSVRENIACGSIDDLKDMGRIATAAQKSMADEFIARLAYGYDTLLSRAVAGGQELSTGQWQRVCLARLFLKDAPVLIWDEPTASVDVATEAQLLTEIAKLARDRICILSSHRVARSDIADKVLMLGEGRVLEYGSHGDLLNKRGAYWRYRQLCESLVGMQPCEAC